MTEIEVQRYVAKTMLRIFTNIFPYQDIHAMSRTITHDLDIGLSKEDIESVRVYPNLEWNLRVK